MDPALSTAVAAVLPSLRHSHRRPPMRVAPRPGLTHNMLHRCIRLRSAFLLIAV